MSTGPVTPTKLDETTLLAALGDPTRWRILEHLATTELCTTHLQQMLDIKQPLMSHHLRVLREAGVVTTQPCGRYTYYRLRPGALDALGHQVSSLAAASYAVPERRSC